MTPIAQATKLENLKKKSYILSFRGHHEESDRERKKEKKKPRILFTLAPLPQNEIMKYKAN